LHGDPALREKLGRNGHAFAVEDCSHIRAAKESRQIYQELLSRRAAGTQASGLQELKKTVEEAKQSLVLLENYLSLTGVEQLERSAYDRGYAAGLDDGKSDGYQRGQRDVMHSDPLVTAIFRMRKVMGLGQ